MTESSGVEPDHPAPGWEISPGDRVWFGGHNTEAKRVVEQFLHGTTRPPQGPIDAAFVVPQSTDEAHYFVAKLRDRLLPTSRVWLVIAKPDSPLRNDLDICAEDLQQAMIRTGFSEIGAVTLSEDFTSLGYRPPA